MELKISGSRGLLTSYFRGLKTLQWGAGIPAMALLFLIPEYLCMNENIPASSEIGAKERHSAFQGGRNSNSRVLERASIRHHQQQPQVPQQPPEQGQRDPV